MYKQATIYMAVAPEDQPIADILQAYLQSTGFRFIGCDDVQHIMNPVTDLYGTMNECDTIVLIDSQIFRAQAENYELKFAQQLSKPLVVISLHQALDENKSNHRVRLFDFTRPQHRDWMRVVDAIIQLTQAVTAELEFGLLY